MERELFIIVLIAAILLILLACLLGGCSAARKPVMTQRPQQPLTAKQQALKERYIEQLRQIFYGSDVEMYLAIERIGN